MRLFFFLFVLTTYTWGQSSTKSQKEAVNAHITYVNHGNSYLVAVSHSLKEFNYQLNHYVDSGRDGYRPKIDSLVITYPHYSVALGLDRTHFENEFKKLETTQAILSTEQNQALTKATKAFHTKLIAIVTTVTALKKITRETSHFSDKQCKESYDFLQQYEQQLAKIKVLNASFAKTAASVFGTEKLPLPLQRTKEKVLLAKQMIHATRAKNKEELGSILERYQQLSVLRNTEDELRVLEKFGDFGYFDNRQGQEHANIYRAINSIVYARSVAYIEGHEISIKGRDVTTYGDWFYYLETMIHELNSEKAGIVARYNTYIKRATEPIAQLVTATPYFETKIKEVKIAETKNISPKTPPILEKNLYSLEGAATNNLVLLLDVSLSMSSKGKLDKLKTSIIHLIDILRPEDQLSVIVYSGKAKEVLKTSTHYDKDALKQVIKNLKSKGKTNANTGLKMAYRKAQKNYIMNGNNRIIIASDGDFEINEGLYDKIVSQARKKIYLSAFQYTATVHKQKERNTLRSLAKLGEGVYVSITETDRAIEALVKESKRLVY